MCRGEIFVAGDLWSRGGCVNKEEGKRRQAEQEEKKKKKKKDL